MSYRIKYQWASFHERSVRDDRFVVAIEGGDNNVWTGSKRARSWSVCMLGSANQMLRQGGVLRRRSACKSRASPMLQQII